MVRIDPRMVLAFASIVEIGTGILMILAPGVLGRLLLGAEIAGTATVLARLFGIALICLGMACWPGGTVIARHSAPAFAMLTYNALIAVMLTYHGLWDSSGVLLWPAVMLHAVVAVLLVRAKKV